MNYEKVIADVERALQNIETMDLKRTTAQNDKLPARIKTLVEEYNQRGRQLQQQQSVFWIKEKIKLTEELASKTQKLQSLENFKQIAGNFFCF